jgi:hypothetical protein
MAPPMTLSAFLDLLDHPRRSGRGWISRCPAHADRSPSLSISEGDDGRVLLRCFSGCTVDEITAALGLSLRDLFPGDKPLAGTLRETKRRREAGQRIDQAESQKAALFRESQAAIEAARGIDAAALADDGRDLVMDQIGDAYAILREEQQGDRLSKVEAAWTDGELRVALDQFLEAR